MKAITSFPVLTTNSNIKTDYLFSELDGSENHRSSYPDKGNSYSESRSNNKSSSDKTLENTAKIEPAREDLVNTEAGGYNSESFAAEEEISAGAKQGNLASFGELAKLFYDKGEILLYHYIYDEIQLVEFDSYNKKIVVSKNSAKKTNNRRIKELLFYWTSENWNVIISDKSGNASLLSQEVNENNNYIKKATENEEISYLLNLFPEAKIKMLNNPEGLEEN